MTPADVRGLSISEYNAFDAYMSDYLKEVKNGG